MDEREKTDERVESRRKFADMTDAAAELIVKAIDGAEPDPKILRHITGALKDLRELMDGEENEEDGIIIRVEGGAPSDPR